MLIAQIDRDSQMLAGGRARLLFSVHEDVTVLHELSLPHSPSLAFLRTL